MVDILAVCAHPDDLEVCASGIFLKAKKEGLKTGLVIFTRGESGGYAEKGTREAEAKKAAGILGLDYFVMLDFPDAGVYFGKETVDALIPHLRKCSPRYVLTLLEDDYHPDHVAVSRITKAACFTAGLKKYSEDDTDWHYDAMLYFGADNRTNKRRPDIYVDITDVIETKKLACEAHQSQEVLPYAMSLSTEYGKNANVEYAEGLFLEQSITVDSISSIMKKI
ncbi:MAG: carbohydrate esterase [Clostridia bacterium]|nr:carbohydrate esterase [Clostridia bacterium]NCC42511.1 carbohydrate esterase [Clostridia bacterium]